MESKLPAIDDLISLEAPSEPKISPNGQWITYTVLKADWKENQFVSQIHLIENEEDAVSHQLTYNKYGSDTPSWSPDGQYITFLSRRHGDPGTQIYRLSGSGGEAERLTEFKGGIRDYRHAPDGKSIAFWAVPPDTPKEKKRKETYGRYVEDNVDYRHAHLWVLTLEDRQVKQLTFGDDFHVRDCVWHPDSRQLAITAMPTPDMDTFLKTRIYLLDVETSELRPLCPLRSISPVWSPDGSELAYQQGVHEEPEGALHKNGLISIITLADETIRSVPAELDEDLTPLFWSADGIYFWALYRTESHLYRVSAAGGPVEQVTPHDIAGFAAFEFSFDQKGSHCATVAASRDFVGEVATLQLPGGNSRSLTTYNDATSDWELPQHEVYRWQSLDGAEIEGVLTRPLDFDPEKTYPLLVVIHGGPAWASQQLRCGRYERRAYPLYHWLDKGAIILQPNYRGSSGYGEAFRSLNVRDMGTGDYADVISGVDALIAEGWVDPEQVGAMGWSQGGYISAFITTYSDRFKAVSVGAGISNWMTYYVNTDIHPFTRNYLGATPWDDPDIYAKTSPMTYIKQAQTPTLIQHGENDRRVPLPNAFELHQGLLDRGVESKLVVYPGMGHGPTKPKQMRHIMTDNLNWFNRHVLGVEAEVESDQALYLLLPPADAESKVVAKAGEAAKRDQALYRILGRDGTFIEKLPESDSEETLTMDDAGRLAKAIAEQLAELKVKSVAVYTADPKEYPKVLIALGCVQIAAGSLGEIMVEHRSG